MAFFATHRSLLQTTLCSAFLVAPRFAQADCAAPPPVVWSYPADGATDIPTDAIFIVAGSVEQITLDGATLAPIEPGFAYELGGLQPHTEYTVEVAADEWSDAEDVTVTFTTGDGPMNEHSRRAIATEEDCQALQDWQVCFDTTPRRSTKVELPDADVAAWALFIDEGQEKSQVALWPASCGRLELDRSVEGAQLMARELFENGAGEDLEPTIVPESEGTCSWSSSPSPSTSLLSWLAGIAVIGAFMRRHRVRNP